MCRHQQRKTISREKRRVWNQNYRRWVASDPNFAMKYELCYSYVYEGIPGGWFLQKIDDINRRPIW